MENNKPPILIPSDLTIKHNHLMDDLSLVYLTIKEIGILKPRLLFSNEPELPVSKGIMEQLQEYKAATPVDIDKLTIRDVEEAIKSYRRPSPSRQITLQTGYWGMQGITMAFDYAGRLANGTLPYVRKKLIFICHRSNVQKKDCGYFRTWCDLTTRQLHRAYVSQTVDYDSGYYRNWSNLGILGAVDEDGYIWKVENGKLTGDVPIGQTPAKAPRSGHSKGYKAFITKADMFTASL